MHLICTMHSTPLIKGDSQLVCTYFPEIFGAFQPFQPLHPYLLSADTCPSTSSGIHKPDRAVVGLYYVTCAHCQYRKQTKPLQNTPFRVLIVKNSSVPISRNSYKSRQALVPTSLKYNLRGISVSIIKGSFFLMGKTRKPNGASLYQVLCSCNEFFCSVIVFKTGQPRIAFSSYL